MRLAFTQIAPGQKIPTNKGWNLRENAIYDKSKLNGGNVGLLLAYCDPVPLCSLDIDYLPGAKPILSKIGIDPETIDAAKIKSGREHSLKLIFKLPQGSEPLRTQVISEGSKVLFELRCATTKGRTVCEVIPPSKHPSGSTYCWDGIRDLDSVTEIPKELLNYWLSRIEAEKAKKQAAVRSTLSNSQGQEPVDDSLLRDLLSSISSDCDYHTWIEILFAIKSTGLLNAEDIACSWSERASTRFDYTSFKAAWDSCQDGHYTVGTLFHHAKQGGWKPENFVKDIPFMESNEPETNETSTAKIIEPEEPDPLAILLSWSATGHSEEMRQRMLDDKFVLKDMAILGQLTAFYAAPGAGKTLLILWGVIEQVKSGELDGGKVYYVNADDHGKGSVTKVKICESVGIQMLIPNEYGFKTKHLFPMMRILIEKKRAKGIVIIMDTLKKFCELMDKKSASDFGKLGREFVQAGGTLIVLAHTNKHKKDGEPVYGGTSDIVDDADCVFILHKISEDNDLHTVEVKNKKARGDVASKLCFQFTRVRGEPYESLLNSVEELPLEVVETVKLNAEALLSLKENSAVIKVIQEVIRESDGRWTKGDIVAEVNKRSTVGIIKIREIIQLHEGDNYDEHCRWTGVKEGNRHKYVLLNPQSIK